MEDDLTATLVTVSVTIESHILYVTAFRSDIELRRAKASRLAQTQ
jgi:hypothetical protein